MLFLTHLSAHLWWRTGDRGVQGTGGHTATGMYSLVLDFCIPTLCPTFSACDWRQEEEKQICFPVKDTEDNREEEQPTRVPEYRSHGEDASSS